MRAYNAIHGIERCPVQWGDVVVVQGSGPVGIAALAVARQAGAMRIIVTGGPAHRLELAREFGADVLIDVGAVDAAERKRQVLAETGGYGADVVIECVGHPEAVNEGLEYCRDGARFLVLGQYANAGNISFNPHTITRKQLQITGSWGFEPRHVDRALRLLESTGWKRLFARQITHRFPLDQADEALATTRTWQSGKTVIHLETTSTSADTDSAAGRVAVCARSQTRRGSIRPCRSRNHCQHLEHKRQSGADRMGGGTR